METGLSLIDVHPLTVPAETLYILEAQDIVTKWRWSGGGLKAQAFFWSHPSAW